MIVESNYVIAIATLNDWHKILASVFQPMRSKTRTNRTTYAWVFPRFERVTGKLLGIVIGSSRCSFVLWLVEVIALVLVFRQPFENRSIGYRQIRMFHILLYKRAKIHSAVIWSIYVIPHLFPKEVLWELLRCLSRSGFECTIFVRSERKVQRNFSAAEKRSFWLMQKPKERSNVCIERKGKERKGKGCVRLIFLDAVLYQRLVSFKTFIVIWRLSGVRCNW